MDYFGVVLYMLFDKKAHKARNLDGYLQNLRKCSSVEENQRFTIKNYDIIVFS